jgi:UDP-glucose 4-epimerase
MRVLVTGGAGFIGGHSCRLLMARGHEVVALDDLSHGKRETVPQGVRLVVRDVRATDVLQGEKPEAVLHLAAQMDVRKSVADPLFDASVNVLGTLNLLEAARRAGAKRFVFASSGGAIYGEQETFPASESHPRRPASPYGVSKLCGEEYVAHYALAHGMSTLSLRYANVYGPGQDPLGEAGVVAIFLHKMLGGHDPIVNGDGEQTRDYVHVEDVARINCDALESGIGGALNVGTRRETSVNELAGLLARACGFSGAIRHGPAKPGEQRRSSIDASAARAQLGWEPRMALEPGLAQTARSFQDLAAKKTS